MTDDELTEMLSNLESDIVERTSSIRDTDKFGEAICAFANDLPDHRQSGVLFLGVNNDGSCANIEITDQLLQNLGARASAQDDRLLTEKRRFRDQPFDLRPILSASLEDLDREMFERIYLPSSILPKCCWRTIGITNKSFPRFDS